MITSVFRLSFLKSKCNRLQRAECHPILQFFQLSHSVRLGQKLSQCPCYSVTRYFAVDQRFNSNFLFPYIKIQKVTLQKNGHFYWEICNIFGVLRIIFLISFFSFTLWTLHIQNIAFNLLLRFYLCIINYVSICNVVQTHFFSSFLNTDCRNWVAVIPNHIAP